MQISERQAAIYSTWENTDSNLLVQAVAGSGKTTTLMGILERSKYRTLFVAFNKSIQEDIEAKIIAKGYKHAKAMTLHSLGLKAVRDAWRQWPPIISGKNYELIKAVKEYNKRSFSRLAWEEKAKIQMTLMEMNDVSRIILSDDKTEIFAMMDTMDKYYFEHPELDVLWADMIFIRDDFDRTHKMMDFLDMIYLPVKYKMTIPVKPYYLLIDECQDLNKLQHIFIDQLLAQGDVNKWVAVGDRRQAIYGFSGSDANSFDSFSTRENVVELPLDVNYRCPQRIVAEANKVYDVMTGFKTDEGIVADIDNPIHIKDGSMVVCRNTAPLLDMYFMLFGMNKRVHLKGEDILGSVTRFLKVHSNKTITLTMKVLQAELDDLKEMPNKSQEMMFKMYRVKEQVKIFSVLVKNYPNPHHKVSELITKFEQIFQTTEDEKTITLCTIHKSKGLEADVVYILDEFLIPSRFAKSPSQLEQEENLRYVARTRAKKEMYYLTIKEHALEDAEEN